MLWVSVGSVLECMGGGVLLSSLDEVHVSNSPMGTTSLDTHPEG